MSYINVSLNDFTPTTYHVAAADSGVSNSAGWQPCREPNRHQAHAVTRNHFRGIQIGVVASDEE